MNYEPRPKRRAALPEPCIQAYDVIEPNETKSAPMRYERRNALNLMHRKVDLVITDELMHVDTKPLIRQHNRINFARGQGRQNEGSKPNPR